jgi:hypothetical protein
VLDFGGVEAQSGGYKQFIHGLLRIELEHKERSAVIVDISMNTFLQIINVYSRKNTRKARKYSFASRNLYFCLI